MKRLEVSKLMDEYVDNEFFPEGGETADVQAVKDRVLAQAAPAKRRKTPLKMVLLAAALGVAGLLCIAATGPLTQLYHMVSGDSMLIQTDPTGQHYLHISWQDTSTPIVLEDGRLWLVVGDERTDVTDLIDENTPYIVEGEDPDSGLKNYLIVGGTPEDYGWQIWMEMPLGGYSGGGWNTYTTYYDVDGKLIEYHVWNAENHSIDGEPLLSELVPDTVVVNKPWYDAADAQLGLWD